MKTKTDFPAFTLAEVLVTLAIIGVIAAISVPTLLQSTNNAEAKTQWKQNYAVMSQATNQMIRSEEHTSELQSLIFRSRMPSSA